MIRLTDVRIDDTAHTLVREVLQSGQLAQGPKVAAFEAQFADLTGTRQAVATSSGTTALVLALEALDLRPGDEVITSAYTFVATLNAILEAGAVARLVDINLDDFTLDPKQVEAAVGPRTRAIIPVHLYGCPADMAVLAEIAERRGIAIIEDAAQAHGATVDGKPAGSWGVGCFSFYATKNITTGEGGMITTDDDATADRVRVLRNQGMRARYQYEEPGHNFRLTDLQAAVGLSQLSHLQSWTRRRQENAERLTNALRQCESVRPPRVPHSRTHVFHQYTVLLSDDSPARDDVIAALRERGVESGVYYPRPVHDYDCYRNHSRVVSNEVPVTVEASRRVLSLPVHQWLTDSDIDQVASALIDVTKRR